MCLYLSFPLSSHFATEKSFSEEEVFHAHTLIELEVKNVLKARKGKEFFVRYKKNENLLPIRFFEDFCELSRTQFWIKNELLCLDDLRLKRDCERKLCECMSRSQ